MKKQLLFGILLAFGALMPYALFAQSTEGTDFWVTLMRGDERKYDDLLLKFSANQATKVYVENAETGYSETVELGDKDIQTLNLNANEGSCYVTDEYEETPVYRALHVKSDKPISLIAANYKNKSFDVAAILPTSALLSEYRIQCYSPYAHADSPQGSHFAIVAADDNVIVDITPSVNTSTGKAAGEMFSTEPLKKGQVFYVWTGKKAGDNADLTGTVVKARSGKKIAVFNGNSHTNIPAIEDRDHIFSQAMPVNYWGRQFAITSSLTTIAEASGYWERIDKIRVQAIVDGTEVKIDGKTVHTFDFVNGPADDKKHFYEFDFGAKDSKTGYDGDGHDFFEGASHFIETSCPCAVHLFMTSNRYDHKKIKGVNEKYCNGDPSLIWINPIEQRIDTLTFGTFETQQVKDHFLNIIATKENVASVRLDNNDISAQFSELNGNPEYVFARITGLPDGTHTLTCDSGFIAHVYGFGQRESYGYPAGGRTKDLTASVLINGQEFKPGNDNLICGDEGVVFSCDLNYDIDSIYWFFGDGKDTLLLEPNDVEHIYEKAGLYEAYVRIFRPAGEASECLSWSDNVYDIIDFNVNIGNFKIDLVRTELPSCMKVGDEGDLKIYLDNPAGVSLTSDSVSLKFNQTALDDGFKNSDITITDDSILTVHVPGGAKPKASYALHLHIGSQCPNSVLDKDLEFTLQFDIPVLTQRYDNVLGVLSDSFPTQTLSNFVWFHNGDTIPKQQAAVLYLDESNPDNSGDYHVCFDVAEEGKADYRFCTCAITFKDQGTKHDFSVDAEDLIITAAYKWEDKQVFVNADYKGETDIECYAQWIDVSGHLVGDRHTIPDGGCTIPAPSAKGMYLLRVVTGKGSRSFKFVFNN